VRRTRTRMMKTKMGNPKTKTNLGEHNDDGYHLPLISPGIRMRIPGFRVGDRARSRRHTTRD
jgi:hypothetical protein